MNATKYLWWWVNIGSGYGLVLPGCDWAIKGCVMDKGIPIITLRWSDDHLRFIMGIPIPIRRCLLSEYRPRVGVTKHFFCSLFPSFFRFILCVTLSMFRFDSSQHSLPACQILVWFKDMYQQKSNDVETDSSAKCYFFQFQCVLLLVLLRFSNLCVIYMIIQNWFR